jgi:hypothetical protein
VAEGKSTHHQGPEPIGSAEREGYGDKQSEDAINKLHVVATGVEPGVKESERTDTGTGDLESANAVVAEVPTVDLDGAGKAIHDLNLEAITLRFDTVGDPLPDGILSILEDYQLELNRGFLNGYIFDSRQLSLVNPPEHDLLVRNFHEHGYRGLQRQVRELENWYIRGTVTLLNLLFVGEKQTSYAWRSVYRFNRAVRHYHVTLMRKALPESLRVGRYGEDFGSGPLGGSSSEIEIFYGRAVILIDLWNPGAGRRRLGQVPDAMYAARM